MRTGDEGFFGAIWPCYIGPVQRLFPLWIFASVLAILLAVGCDPVVPEQEVSPEQIVKGRAEARWVALCGRDFESAYQFESPAYRQVVTFDRFRSRFGESAVWRGAEATSVELDEQGESADVVLTLDYTSALPTGETYEGRRGITEKWVHSEGEWWILTD